MSGDFLWGVLLGILGTVAIIGLIRIAVYGLVAFYRHPRGPQ